MPCSQHVFIDDIPHLSFDTIKNEKQNCDFLEENIRMELFKRYNRNAPDNIVLSIEIPNISVNDSISDTETDATDVESEITKITESEITNTTESDIIILSEKFLNSVDIDIAEMAKNAVYKLNESIIQQKRKTKSLIILGRTGDVKVSSALHFIPRPIVSIREPRKNTIIPKQYNNCGCFPFSMKHIFTKK